MGVHGITKLLHERGLLPSLPSFDDTDGSLFPEHHDSSSLSFSSSFSSSSLELLQPIPSGSVLLIDGNGVAFFSSSSRLSTLSSNYPTTTEQQSQRQQQSKQPEQEPKTTTRTTKTLASLTAFVAVGIVASSHVGICVEAPPRRVSTESVVGWTDYYNYNAYNYYSCYF